MTRVKEESKVKEMSLEELEKRDNTCDEEASQQMTKQPASPRNLSVSARSSNAMALTNM